MSKEQAQKEVQRLLKEAHSLVHQAEALMDEHRFAASFLNKSYCPRDLSSDELEGDQFVVPQWADVGDGGIWMSSSDMC